MAITQYENICLNIPEIVEEQCMFDDEKNVIYVYCHAAEDYTDYCPKCGCFNYIKGGKSKRRLIHDISFGDKSVDILLKAQRYRCKDCGSSFFQPFDFVDTRYWLTKRAIRTISKQALIRSFSSVAIEYGITVTTVAKIMTDYCSELDKKRVIVAPKVLGIDEVHIGKKMRGVLIDVEKGELLDITEDRKIPTIEAAILNMKDYYKNIKIVTMDMSGGYKTVVETQLEADVIVDKFHVLQNLYRACAKAKNIIAADLREQVKGLPEGPDKKKKHDLLVKMGKEPFLFKYSDTKLNPVRLVLMKDLCSTFPELKQLYELKLLGESLYQCKGPIDSTKKVQEINDSIPDTKAYEDFRKFGRSLNNWLHEINNYFAHGCKYTNAATEGLNSKIKAINHVGRGYSYETLRLKCIHSPKVRADKNIHARTRPQLPYFEYAGPSAWEDFFGHNPNEYNTSIQLLINNMDDIF